MNLGPHTHKAEVVTFFQKLYGEIPSSLGCLPSNAFLRLDLEDVSLERSVSNEEIKTTLFDMVYWKASGSDGFNTGFFKANEIIYEEPFVNRSRRFSMERSLTRNLIKLLLS